MPFGRSGQPARAKHTGQAHQQSTNARFQPWACRASPALTGKECDKAEIELQGGGGVAKRWQLQSRYRLVDKQDTLILGSRLISDHKPLTRTPLLCVLRPTSVMSRSPDPSTWVAVRWRGGRGRTSGDARHDKPERRTARFNQEQRRCSSPTPYSFPSHNQNLVWFGVCLFRRKSTYVISRQCQKEGGGGGKTRAGGLVSDEHAPLLLHFPFIRTPAHFHPISAKRRTR